MIELTLLTLLNYVGDNFCEYRNLGHDNSFYQVIPLEKPYFKKTKKKASHKCGRVMGNLIFKPNS